jgi:hypothetical protein
MPHPHYQADAATGKLVQVSDPTWAAPRLCLALREAPVGTFPVFQTGFEKRKADAIKAGKTLDGITPADLATRHDELLQHIQDRLEMGLTEAWLSPQGYGSWPDFEKLAAAYASATAADKAAIEAMVRDAGEISLMWNEPEEYWARELCELFAFSSYAGSDNLYGVSAKKLYAEFPRVFPIVVACQHFSTYAILSRGFKASEVGGGAGCGCAAATVTGSTCFEAQGTSQSLSKDPAWVAAEALFAPDMAAWQQASADYRAAKAAAKPGEAVSVPPPGPAPLHGNAKYGYPRQASPPPFADTSVLTADPIKITPGSVLVFNPGGGGSTYQDLGQTTHIGTVLRVNKPRIQFMDTGVLIGSGSASAGEGGTTDHSFRTGTVVGAGECVGWGRLKPAADLRGAVDAMIKARPLGLVRLVILDTSDDSKPRICWISKLVHMRYPLSRLMWSLRGLPVEGLSVHWLVYAPQNKWAEALIGDSEPGTAPGTLFPAGGGQLFLANVVRGTRDGVSVYRHKSAGADNSWSRDFTLLSGVPAETGLAYRFGPTSPPQLRLELWAGQQGNFGKQFAQLDASSAGTIDEKDPNVAYFKP